MLNRRILRIKAMQALYAYYQAKNAGKNVAVEDLKSAFNPDLNSMELQPSESEVALNKRIAAQNFNRLLKTDSLVFDADTSEGIQSEVTSALESYKAQLKKDENHFKKMMVREVEAIHDRFLKILILPIAFAKQNELEQDKNSKKRRQQPEVFGLYNLSQNQAIKDLLDDTQLETLLIKRNINWNDEADSVKQWYRTIIKEDEEFQNYSAKKAPSSEEDITILNHIYRQIIFRNEELQQFFELWDINWAEDKDIIKSLIKKSLKTYDPDGEVKYTLLEPSINWEEDKEYFEQLYSFTIRNSDDYDKLLAEKSKNWDIERISMTDKIIIEMALAEMINFPSIPVKVSINEYIELSKNYSTPKSKQFVNGVLDVLATEFKESGIIKKSGRGLIDNR